MIRLYVAPVPLQPLASAAVTVIGNVPTALVTPERTPLVVFIVMPAGSEPVTDHVMAPLPPVCVNCSLNAEPAVPRLFAGFVTERTLQAMFSV